MVARLKSSDSEGVSPKRLTIPANAKVDRLDLSNFVNGQTAIFFKLLGISMGFLSLPPSEWPQNQEYQEGLETVSALEVVNDVAERAVHLTSEYNAGKITKLEKSFQNLLLVIHKTRQNDSKSSLTLSHYIEPENK
ncbi:hypothetical protein FOCC_FOCC000195 [Frankliniella occidentalis]|nr:hypothetical protein FOCC_FOCC000195 [Frankliniella occidentalis]